MLKRLGGVSIIYGSIGDGVRFCAFLPSDAAIAEDSRVRFSIAQSDCHVFDAEGKVFAVA